MNPIKVMIADDHLMLREGLKQLLEMDGDIEVIEQANDGFQCLDLLRKSDPDVLLLDINMPNLDGLSVLEKIKKEGYRSKVIILTIHNEIEYLVKAHEKFTDGYVLKDSGTNILKKAIRVVNNGDSYIEPTMVPMLREKLDRMNFESQEELLTKRELEILKLLAEGLYNKEIAFRLSISEKTVKNHVSNIFKKINVSDRTQAAVYAIRNNYVELI